MNARFALARDALSSIQHLHDKDCTTVYIGLDLDSNDEALSSFDVFESTARSIDEDSYNVLVTDDALFLGISNASPQKDKIVEAAEQNLKGWSAPVTPEALEKPAKIQEALLKSA